MKTKKTTKTKNTQAKKQQNKKTLIILLILAVFMFAFSFILVPFYNVLCNVLGLNGKTGSVSQKSSRVIDKSRKIKIEFFSTINPKLPWDLSPNKKQMEVYPGENMKTFYTAINHSDKTITAQAVPSVTPGIASKYFKKIECFCFKQQTLKPHQKIEMPVIFYIDPQLPKAIHEITLSYTMYKVSVTEKE